MKTYWEMREAAMPHPQSNLTKMQRRALASPAARAKPKDQVTLPKMPFLDKDKDKKKQQNERISTVDVDQKKRDLKVARIDKKIRDLSVKEEKGRGPTGIAYSLPKGHPDAENPSTRKKYPERQTPEYKKKFFGKDKSSPSSTGMKEETINESINFKGTPHISLTRYSAQGGFGLQLTQNKRMGNEKFRMGAHVSMPMKDVPKLITALQKVMKAPKNAQLGDDD
jgi:hypothetical protein